MFKTRLTNLLNKLLFCFLAGTRRFRPLKHETGRVLLVHFAHIGDFIIWLDSARAYRQLYAGKKIILLCRTFKDISEIAERTGYFDEVKAVNDGWKARIFSALAMMWTSYDIVVNTRATRELQSDIYVLAPRSGRRIAPYSDLTCINEKWRRQSDLAYTEIIACDGIRKMELIRNAQFVRGQGLTSFRASLPALPVQGNFRPPFQKRYFVVCPGANNEANRWPENRFASVIDSCIQSKNIPCVLVGTANEKKVGEKIQHLSKFSDHILNIMGETSLPMYIEVIRNASFVLSNDTSAAHIAPAVCTPSVVIQPGWNYGRFFPYQIESDEQACSSWLPIAISTQTPCKGCGRDPTKDGNPRCLKNRVMKCVLDVSIERIRTQLHDL